PASITAAPTVYRASPQKFTTVRCKCCRGERLPTPANPLGTRPGHRILPEAIKDFQSERELLEFAFRDFRLGFWLCRLERCRCRTNPKVFAQRGVNSAVYGNFAFRHPNSWGH